MGLLVLQNSLSRTFFFSPLSFFILCYSGNLAGTIFNFQRNRAWRLPMPCAYAHAPLDVDAPCSFASFREFALAAFAAKQISGFCFKNLFMLFFHVLLFPKLCTSRLFSQSFTIFIGGPPFDRILGQVFCKVYAGLCFSEIFCQTICANRGLGTDPRLSKHAPMRKPHPQSLLAVRSLSRSPCGLSTQLRFVYFSLRSHHPCPIRVYSFKTKSGGHNIARGFPSEVVRVYPTENITNVHFPPFPIAGFGQHSSS